MKLPELPPLPTTEYLLASRGNEWEREWITSQDGFSEEDMHAYATTYAEAAVKAEMEACAKLCDDLEVDFWKLYKSRHEVGSGREHTEGKSDGATECAAAIRARSKE